MTGDTCAVRCPRFLTASPSPLPSRGRRKTKRRSWSESCANRPSGRCKRPAVTLATIRRGARPPPQRPRLWPQQTDSAPLRWCSPLDWPARNPLQASGPVSPAARNVASPCFCSPLPATTVLLTLRCSFRVMIKLRRKIELCVALALLVS